MRTGNYGKIRKVMAGAAALCLAVGLVGCTGGNYDEGEKPSSEAESSVLSAEFAQFEELIASQPRNFTVDYQEDYITGKEGTAKKGVTSFTALVDEEGGEALAYIKHGDNDTDFPSGEMYVEGDTTIRIDDDAAIDISANYAEGDQPLSADFLNPIYEAASLKDVTTEDGQTAYHFVFETGLDGRYGMLDAIGNAEDTYVFNEAGELVEEYFHGEGTAEVNGVSVPASIDVTMRFSDWGTTDAPEAPAVEGTLVVGDFADQLKERVQQLPSNLTCQVETETTVTNGDQVQTQTMYVESLIDRADTLKSATYVEIDGNADDAMVTFIDGDRTVMVQHDEIVSSGKTEATGDAAGTEQALAIIDCAEFIDKYELADGNVEYVVGVDPSKLAEGAQFDGIERVTSLTAYYYFDPDGAMEGYAMTVEGVPAGAAAGATMSMDINAYYSDFGTTEVPAMPM